MYCCACCQHFRDTEKEGSDGYCSIDGTEVRLEDVCDEFEIQEVKEGKRGSKMTNREWINTWGDEKFAMMIMNKLCCNFCIYGTDDDCEMNCKKGITDWLKQKHIEPMPEIKAGDLLITENDEFYVAITPNKLVTLRSYVIIDLDNALKYTKFTFVKRYIDDDLKEIWRADDE